MESRPLPRTMLKTSTWGRDGEMTSTPILFWSTRCAGVPARHPNAYSAAVKTSRRTTCSVILLLNVRPPPNTSFSSEDGWRGPCFARTVTTVTICCKHLFGVLLARLVLAVGLNFAISRIDQQDTVEASRAGVGTDPPGEFTDVVDDHQRHRVVAGSRNQPLTTGQRNGLLRDTVKLQSSGRCTQSGRSLKYG